MFTCVRRIRTEKPFFPHQIHPSRRGTGEGRKEQLSVQRSGAPAAWLLGTHRHTQLQPQHTNLSAYEHREGGTKFSRIYLMNSPFLAFTWTKEIQ